VREGTLVGDWSEAGSTHRSSIDIQILQRRRGGARVQRANVARQRPAPAGGEHRYLPEPRGDMGAKRGGDATEGRATLSATASSQKTEWEGVSYIDARQQVSAHAPQARAGWCARRPRPPVQPGI